MKKYCVLLLALFFLTVPVVSQHIDITVNQEVVGSGNGYYYAGSVITTWVPFLDGERINEGYFYKLTGDIKAETAYRNMKTGFWSLLGGGAVMVLAGIIINPDTTNQTQGIIACSCIYGGAGAMLGSLFFTGNARPLPYAARLADAFNASH